MLSNLYFTFFFSLLHLQMAGTSISSSEKREDYGHGNYVTSETVVTSEKVEDFLHTDTNEKHQLDDIERSSLSHLEDEEDSPIEEVRAVVDK